MKKILSIFIVLVISLSNFACGETKDDIPTYSVTVNSTQGGSISASAEEVEFGDNVLITVTANDGYVVAEFKVNNSVIELESDTFLISGAMRDYNIEVSFIKANVIVDFEGDGASELENKSVAYGNTFGKLPIPDAILGKRFVGWVNERGEVVTEQTRVSGKNDVIILTSTYEEVDEEDKELLKPFSITTSYYDMAATSYGVVWHNLMEPIYPVMMIQEGNSVKPDEARIINGDYEHWFDGEYVVNAVVDNLKFNTTYTVKLGDLSADVWSNTYTFTTREEYLEEANFIYITDSQENYRIENMGYLTSFEGIGYLGDTYSHQVLKEATARFPEADFMTHGGDLINWGIEPRYWEEMLGSWEEYLFNYPMMATAGNHEEPLWYAFGRKNDIVNKMFNVDWQEDAFASSGMFYSFDYGPLHFITLRSNDIFNDNKGVLSETQVNWLKNDVAAARERTGIKWIVGMMHEGPIIPSFSKMTSNAHVPTLGGQLVPLFDELDIDLILYGHNHYLDSSWPIVWDETADPLPYTDYASLVERGETKEFGLAKEIRARAVTTQVEPYTLADGTVVSKIVYPEGTTDRGTVYHQVSCSGPQVNKTYSYKQLAQNLEDKIIYRNLLSGGVGMVEVNGEASTVPYCGYSYVEVTASTLTVRTYGVYAKGVYEETDVSKYSDHAVLMDGFMLEK